MLGVNQAILPKFLNLYKNYLLLKKFMDMWLLHAFEMKGAPSVLCQACCQKALLRNVPFQSSVDIIR